MARVGGGEVDYVLLNTSGEEVGKKFYQRIATPILTDISLSLDGLSLEERFPEAVADLWDRKPLIFKARYTSPGKGTVTIKGFSGGKPYEQRLEVTLPDKESANSSLGPLWARAKVDDLMGRDWMGLQRGNPKTDIKEEIVRVALAHRIMTQFTSFVAVEETVVTVGGKPTKVTVPVEMPDGVSRERIFGDAAAVAAPQGALRFHGLPAGRVAGGRAKSMEYPASAPMTRQVVAGTAPRKEAKQASLTDKLRAPAEKDPRAEVSEKEDRRVASLEQKLSPDLAALVALKERPKDYAAGKVTVKDGKTTVQVWVAKTTDEVLEKLKAAGLEVSFTASTGKMVIGLIAVDKLEELAKISEVSLIEPVTAG
jgi:Ca-activated chloride channel homolog